MVSREAARNKGSRENAKKNKSRNRVSDDKQLDDLNSFLSRFARLKICPDHNRLYDLFWRIHFFSRFRVNPFLRGFA